MSLGKQVAIIRQKNWAYWLGHVMFAVSLVFMAVLFFVKMKYDSGTIGIVYKGNPSYVLYIIIGFGIFAFLFLLFGQLSKANQHGVVFENGIIVYDKYGEQVFYFDEIADWLLLVDKQRLPYAIAFRGYDSKWIIFDKTNGGMWLKKLNKVYTVSMVNLLYSEFINGEELAFNSFPELDMFKKKLSKKKILVILSEDPKLVLLSRNRLQVGSQAVKTDLIQDIKRGTKGKYLLMDGSGRTVWSFQDKTLSKQAVFLTILDQYIGTSK